MEIRYIYMYICGMYHLTLVPQAHNHVRWAEFCPSHCSSNVASDNQSLKMNLTLLFSIEFSDYGAKYSIKTKPTLYPR